MSRVPNGKFETSLRQVLVLQSHQLECRKWVEFQTGSLKHHSGKKRISLSSNLSHSVEQIAYCPSKQIAYCPSEQIAHRSQFKNSPSYCLLGSITKTKHTWTSTDYMYPWSKPYKHPSKPNTINNRIILGETNSMSTSHPWMINKGDNYQIVSICIGWYRQSPLDTYWIWNCVQNFSYCLSITLLFHCISLFIPKDYFL